MRVGRVGLTGDNPCGATSSLGDSLAFAVRFSRLSTCRTAHIALTPAGQMGVRAGLTPSAGFRYWLALHGDYVARSSRLASV